jgi:hypothetical protein
LNTKIKFDAKSIKFRLWIYFVAFAIGLVLLIWFLQIFFLNNYYEHMKVSEVNHIATSICHAYTNDDDDLTEKIQELSVSNDFYVMMESGGQLLLFMPESDSILPVYKYKNEVPQLKSMLEKESKNGVVKSKKNKNGSVSFKLNAGFEGYSTLAYACYIDNTAGSEVILYIFSPL